MSGGEGASEQEKLSSAAFEVIRKAVDLDSQLVNPNDVFSHRSELIALYTKGLELLISSLEHADEDDPSSRALAQRVLRNHRTVTELAVGLSIAALAAYAVLKTIKRETV